MPRKFKIHVDVLDIQEIEIDDETLENIGDEDSNPDFYDEVLQIAKDEINDCEHTVDWDVQPEEVQ